MAMNCEPGASNERSYSGHYMKAGREGQMRKTHIIIHHTDGDDGPAANIASIRHWHKDHLNYADIGYHAVCELVGEEYEIIIGRDWDWDGAHTLGHNQTGFGFSFVGRFTDYEIPEAQLVRGVMGVRMIMKTLGIPPSAVFPHRQFNSTDCPGKLFPWDRFVKMIGG